MNGLPAVLALVAISACTDSIDERAFEERANALTGEDNCNVEATCGDLVYVDGGAAVDGPAYYFDRSGGLISRCGGACFLPMMPEQVDECATLCPPPDWTCSH
ncbi:MAG: hypothetical protein JWP01_1138 [Myxococcales bacterium]|nr:hypothetical protein [Myxococcales bacterium]